jgi:hypothetical protein
LWGKTSVILGFQSLIEKFGYFFAVRALPAWRLRPLKSP